MPAETKRAEMRIDLHLTGPLADAGGRAAEAAAAGADGAFVFEGPGDPFLPLAVAGATGAALDLYPNVAIAPPRSPMHLALSAWDLQRVSEGRFALGLGTQIRPHIERRFGMPWWPPITRMREVLRALRAIFTAFQDGTPLAYEGETTTHTLLPPALAPPPLETGPPPLWCAAVGPQMTRLAAAEADGLVTHPLASARTLREHSLAHLHEGLAAAGRQREALTVVGNVLVALHGEDEDPRPALDALRAIVGFYGSTPSYRVLLEVHGHGDLQPRLRELTRAGRWGELPDLVDDELVRTFAVCAPPAAAAQEIVQRFGGVADRVALGVHHGGDELVTELVAELRARRPDPLR